MWLLAAMTFTLKTILWAASLKHSEWCCLPTETNGLLDLMGWKQKMQIKHWLFVPWPAAPYMKLWKCSRNLLEYSQMIGHIQGSFKEHFGDVFCLSSALTTHDAYPSFHSTRSLLLTGTPSSTPADRWPFHRVCHTKHRRTIISNQ
jgi:hypothetical protein